MKLYRVVGVKCPFCGEQRLQVTFTRDQHSRHPRSRELYAVNCLPVPEQAPCSRRTWGVASTGKEALIVAVTNMVVELDPNMKTKVADRAKIVASLLKQLQPVEPDSPA